MYMLLNTTAQAQIIAMLESLADAETLPAGIKIDTYVGQIDIIKLAVDAGSFPAILVAWQYDAENEFIVENREDELEFSLLICTNSASGMGEALGILDTLKQNFFGQWNDEDGLRLFDVFRGAARALFNLKLKQVITLRVRVRE